MLERVDFDPGSCPGVAGDCLVALATDGASVYFALDGSGAVGKVPVAGGGATRIAGDDAWAVAVDDACVYWSTDAGAIMAAPK